MVLIKKLVWKLSSYFMQRVSWKSGTKHGGAVSENKYLQIHLQISTPVVNKYLQFDQNLLPGSREEIEHICLEGEILRGFTPPCSEN